jgi:hypothetical protein
MKSAIIAVIFMAVCSAAVRADWPPAIKVPGDVPNRLAKAAVVHLAAFPSYLSFEKRGFQQGGDYDTKDYCSATIDVGADPGVRASIVILGVDSSQNTYETFPQPQSVVLTGREKPDVDSVVDCLS